MPSRTGPVSSLAGSVRRGHTVQVGREGRRQLVVVDKMLVNACRRREQQARRDEDGKDEGQRW